MCVSGSVTPGVGGMPQDPTPDSAAVEVDGMNRSQECSVCLAAFAPESQKRKLDCGHVFHLNCIKQWLNIKPTCPNCRSGVILRPEFVEAVERDEDLAPV